METLLDWMEKKLTGCRLSRKTCAIVLLILFVLSMLPVCAVSFYTSPTADDFSFGLYNHHAVQNGENYIMAAVRQTVNQYMTWQGFFQSSFWAAIQPFNINVHLYFLSNLLVIGAVLFSFFYFCRTVLMNLFHLDRWDYLLITVPLAVVLIQFLPSLWEGFYWMDGSMEFFYAVIEILVFAFVINYHLSGKKVYAWLAYAGIALFCGSDIHPFVRLVYCFGIALLFTVPRKWKVSKLMIGLFVLNAALMAVALAAPGNWERRDVTEHLSFLASVLEGIRSAAQATRTWTNFMTISVLLFCGLVFAPRAEKMTFTFPHPWLVPLLGFGLYAGSMAAHCFSVGFWGSPRQINQYYYLYVLTAGGSALYFTGWLVKQGILRLRFTGEHFSAAVLLPLVLLMALEFTNTNIRELSTPQTAVSLLRGRVQAYHREMMDRIALYEDPDVQDVVIEPLSVDIPFLGDSPFSSVPDEWPNTDVIAYYGKRSVVMYYGEDDSEMTASEWDAE